MPPRASSDRTTYRESIVLGASAPADGRDGARSRSRSLTVTVGSS
jgi:hypothetical protein